MNKTRARGRFSEEYRQYILANYERMDAREMMQHLHICRSTLSRWAILSGIDKYLQKKKDNVIGKRYSYLTVIDQSKEKVLCRCDCGVTFWTLKKSLDNGLTRSCGCLKGIINRKKPKERKAYSDEITRSNYTLQELKSL